MVRLLREGAWAEAVALADAEPHAEATLVLDEDENAGDGDAFASDRASRLLPDVARATAGFLAVSSLDFAAAGGYFSIPPPNPPNFSRTSKDAKTRTRRRSGVPSDRNICAACPSGDDGGSTRPLRRTSRLSSQKVSSRLERKHDSGTGRFPNRTRRRSAWRPRRTSRRTWRLARFGRAIRTVDDWTRRCACYGRRRRGGRVGIGVGVEYDPRRRSRRRRARRDARGTPPRVRRLRVRDARARNRDGALAPPRDGRRRRILARTAAACWPSRRCAVAAARTPPRRISENSSRRWAVWTIRRAWTRSRGDTCLGFSRAISTRVCRRSRVRERNARAALRTRWRSWNPTAPRRRRACWRRGARRGCPVAATPLRTSNSRWRSSPRAIRRRRSRFYRGEPTSGGDAAKNLRGDGPRARHQFGSSRRTREDSSTARASRTVTWTRSRRGSIASPSRTPFSATTSRRFDFSSKVGGGSSESSTRSRTLRRVGRRRVERRVSRLIMARRSRGFRRGEGVGGGSGRARGRGRRASRALETTLEARAGTRSEALRVGPLRGENDRRGEDDETAFGDVEDGLQSLEILVVRSPSR